MFTGSFVAMFITMYAMVYVWDHIYFNINKVYMAGLMTAAMAIVNPITMGMMYKDRPRLRWGIFAMGVVYILVTFLLIRGQTFVGDTQFLKSMIPHHSSAILMCEQAKIKDSEIKELCDEIVKTQREEIEIMQRMLEDR